MNQKIGASRRCDAARAMEPEAVSGWASDNHSIDDAPAVIVNPDSEPLTLLSWGIGQLQQCNALLDGLSTGNSEVRVDSGIASGILHFTRQAEIALVASAQKLRRLP